MATAIEPQVDRSPVGGLLSWAPEGKGLQDEAFGRRHALVRTLLLLHVPALAILGIARGYSPVELLEGLVPLAAAWAIAGMGSQQVRAIAVSVGLALSSVVVVVWSGGSIEAHFHVFVVIGFVSIYQDWTAFAAVVALTLGGEALLAADKPSLVFDHASAQASPWTWTAIHAAFVLAECVAMMIFWASTDQESRRATQMATEMTMAELQRTREQADQRQASSDLLTNLARRNQSLLNRQLARIDQLEKDEDDPEVLAQLFTLDHLATRMRRNAESLLVLSGEEPPRRFGAPVPLSEVTRGAIAEVEDYTRADVALAADVLVDGHAVGDMVHLIAELIENAATFSPPSSRVVVSGVPQHDASYVITVDDGGIGMSDAELAEANATLREDVRTQVELSGQLGFHVVARLAARHGVAVTMSRAVGIASTGLRATVHLPSALVSGVPSIAAAAPAEPVAAPVVAAPSGALTAVAPAQPVSTPAPVVNVPSPAPVPAQESIPAPEPVAAPAPAPEPVVAAVPVAAAPAPVPAPVVEAPVDEAVTSSGLQRRVPRASLNANLTTPIETPAQAAAAATAAAPVVEPDPDNIRSSLDAFYGGLARGVASSEGDA